MDAMQNLLERRSVRKYKVDPIPQEVLDRIIQAGLMAPSAKGMQKAIIVAVTNKEVRDRLSETNRKYGGWDQGFDSFYGAPVALVVLAPKDYYATVQDGSLVLGNLMLAAHEQGLGSCWINRAKETFEESDWQDWLHTLGVQGDYEGVGICALGYAEGPISGPGASRKDHRLFWCK